MYLHAITKIFKTNFDLHKKGGDYWQNKNMMKIILQE